MAGKEPPVAALLLTLAFENFISKAHLMFSPVRETVSGLLIRIRVVMAILLSRRNTSRPSDVSMSVGVRAAGPCDLALSWRSILIVVVVNDAVFSLAPNEIVELDRKLLTITKPAAFSPLVLSVTSRQSGENETFTSNSHRFVTLKITSFG